MQSTQPEALWDAILADLVPGEVRCLFASSVVDALETLHRAAANRLPVTPNIVLTWSNAPRIDLAIREIANQFAIATSAAWLQSQQANRIKADCTKADDSPSRVVDETAGQSFPRDPRWFRKVCDLIYANKPPLPNGYPLAESIRRLAFCLSTDPITCLLAVGDQADRSETHLDGLCRGALWVAQQTAGRVALLLPDRLRGDSALASVDFDAVIISDSSAENDQSDWFQHASLNRRTDTAVEQKNRFWPLLGNPHPFSPGEQRLASCLQQHAELRGRFTFNTVVETGSQRRYIVDLLDRELKLVVEVDGYCHHAGKVAFSADRERDFHLTVDGYLVLRIPHHEIIQDVEHAVGKIRTLVRFRQGKLPNLRSESDDR